ncbi:MAG: F0F1 ATP synthase subunit epsilon [Halanaerobiaceae bacterium]|jgi:F-type H+-transporting ATPase subunit epsilon|nr:F0F1 ATP synthase subunit epsilon [Halanaerobiaceae bacterium]
MPSTIRLEVVTPFGLVYRDDIDYLKAPAVDGEIGILPQHAPLVTGLEIGILHVKKGGEEFKIAISEGFLEVKPDNINVIVRTAELQNDIDVERARRARERAEKRLKSGDNSIDRARAEAALKRALARLKAAEYSLQIQDD